MARPEPAASRSIGLRDIATGWPEDPNDPNHPDDPEGRIVSGHGISLLFIPVPEGN